MQEIVGDLFSHNEHGPEAICITTNGYVNRQGANTMGRGCALEAERRWPGIRMAAGTCIRGFGNQVNRLTLVDPNTGQIYLQACNSPLYPRQDVPYHIFTFPVKPEVVDDAEDLLPAYRHRYEGHEEDLGFPGWMAQASKALIQESCVQLKEQADALDLSSVVLPRPGCGAGGLDWEREVRPLCQAYLDDRFYVITFPSKESAR